MHQHELKFTLVGRACPLLPYYPPFTDTYSSARHQPRQGCCNGCRNVTRLSRSRHRGGQVHVIRRHPRSQIEDQTPAQGNQACSKPRRQSVSAQKKGLHDSSHLLSFWSSAVLTVAAWTCHTKTAENLQNTHVDGSALVPLQLQEVIAAQQAQAKNQALLSNSDHWGQWGASLQTHRGVRCGAMISFYF